MRDRLTSDHLIVKLEAVLDLMRGKNQSAIDLKEAAFIAGISESQMRRRCQANIHGVHPDGYGRKLEGDRWDVIAVPFLLSVPLKAIERYREPTTVERDEPTPRA